METVELYNVAEKEGVEIENCSINYPNIYGMYIKDYKVIGINYNLIQTISEEKCVLAEELGHYFTGVQTRLIAGSYREMLQISREERRAERWAIMKLFKSM